jgi:hypothetical protein
LKKDQRFESQNFQNVDDDERDSVRTSTLDNASTVNAYVEGKIQDVEKLREKIG